MEKKYYKCWKCGSLVTTSDEKPTMCVSSVSFRTAGVCGGGYDEITEIEYKTTIERWETEKKRKNNGKKNNSLS